MPAKGSKAKGARTKGVRGKSGKTPKAKAPATRKPLLSEKDLALLYHVLKLLVGSIFRTPDDQINIDDVLRRTKEWLIITPFSRPRLQKALTALATRKLLRRVSEDGKECYRITEQGRRAYKQYREIMTLWRIEKVAGKRLKLYSVSEVLRKTHPREGDYIPDECFMDWPLKFRPIFHRFSGQRELRIYDAFEKVKR